VPESRLAHRRPRLAQKRGRALDAAGSGAVKVDDFESHIRLPRQQLPAAIKAALPQVQASSMLERAKQMLIECITVDMARGIADEAKAVASYYAEKKGAEVLLRMARQIQIRAYRRIGQLLKDHRDEFRKNSMEHTAIRIASLEEASFEGALVTEEILTPTTFAQKYIPRPPPAFKEETPEAKARRWQQQMAQAAEEEYNSINDEIVSFHCFIKETLATSAAAIFETRAEKRRVRDQIREIQEWLDELDRRIKVPPKSYSGKL
jgi:hypothetical protein